MPHVKKVIPETIQSVVRPVTEAIVRQVMQLTGIDKSTKILYPGDAEKTQQPGSSLTGDKERTQFINNGNLIEIKVDGNFNEDSVLSTAVERPEQIPIFLDDKLGVILKPIYVKSDYTITITNRSNSRTAIERWREDIRARYSSGREINEHLVSYHYLIPPELLNILKEIHKLRENVEGYGEDFENYFKNNSTSRLTELTNLAGEQKSYAVTETQIRIVGLFDFKSFPEKSEKESDQTTTYNTFTYKVSIEKPIMCAMRYPVMIHNQLLSPNYRPNNPHIVADQRPKSFSLSGGFLSHFESHLFMDQYIDRYSKINIPWFDEFIPDSVPSGTVNIFNVLCEFALPDKKSLFNLNELGDIYIDEDILNFIKNGEYQYITQPYNSVFKLDLYRGNKLAQEDMLVIDSNLNITSRIDLNVRENNRVRFGLVANLNLLSDQALKRVRSDPKAFVKIVLATNEKMRDNPQLLDLYYKNRVTKDDYNRLIMESKQPLYAKGRMKTAQTAYIVALKKDNYANRVI